MGTSANFNKNILFLKSKYDEDIDYGLIKKKNLTFIDVLTKCII